MTGSQHEVLIVRYGTRTTTRSDVFLNYHAYGEPDGPMEMDYFFWVIRGDAGPVVVDTGFSLDAGRARGRTMLTDPREALAELGISRADAPPVVITHAHYDHIGNLSHFNESPVVVARAEAEFWAGPHARHPLFRHAVEESELAALAGVIGEGRAVLFDDHYEVAPGIAVLRVGGHTPGQSVVVVQTAAGPVVLASDAVHYYEEMERDMPFSSVASLIDMYAAFAELKAMLSDGRAAQVVSGHDPATLDRYPQVPGPAGAKMAVIGRQALMPEEIGFIGLGNMGGRMAVRLAEQGQSVVGYDVVPGLAGQARARAVGSIAEVAAAADVVLLSLPDSKVVESVAHGDGGLLAASREGQVIADLSTAAPASTRELHKRFAAKGVSFLDAGVSGGAAAAEAGTLTVMVGGDQAMLERIRPVLDCIAAKIFYCGAPGSGHTAKLLNNFLNAVSLAATAEAMVAGKKAGLDMETLLNIINSSSGVNFASQNRFTRIIHGDYLKGGLTNTLMMKDVMLYTELIADLGVAGLNATGPLASFGLAKSLGYADQISNRVVDAIGDVSGGVRIQSEGSGQS